MACPDRASVASASSSKASTARPPEPVAPRSFRHWSSASSASHEIRKRPAHLRCDPAPRSGRRGAPASVDPGEPAVPDSVNISMLLSRRGQLQPTGWRGFGRAIPRTGVRGVGQAPRRGQQRLARMAPPMVRRSTCWNVPTTITVVVAIAGDEHPFEHVSRRGRLTHVKQVSRLAL